MIFWSHFPSKLLDPPVQPHEQEVFDELGREVAAAKAKQGREVISDMTEGESRRG